MPEEYIDFEDCDFGGSFDEYLDEIGATVVHDNGRAVIARMPDGRKSVILHPLIERAPRVVQPTTPSYVQPRKSGQFSSPPIMGVHEVKGGKFHDAHHRFVSPKGMQRGGTPTKRAERAMEVNARESDLIHQREERRERAREELRRTGLTPAQMRQVDEQIKVAKKMEQNRIYTRPTGDVQIRKKNGRFGKVVSPRGAKK